MAAAEGALPEGIEQVEVIIGTYEEFVIGYKLTRNNDERVSDIIGHGDWKRDEKGLNNLY